MPPPNPRDGYTPPKGAINMIQKGRPTNRIQKLITWQVNLATLAPPQKPEYLNWSEQSIEFSRKDQPPQVPRPGHAPLVLSAQIGGFELARVFMDAGSEINLIYADTLRAMGINMDNLGESDTCFHGIKPGKANTPLGRITLDVIFGTRGNYRKERLEFEVMDSPSQYHAILGRPAFARFMAIPHYAYLMMKLSGPKGVITIKGSFTLSDKCDREFHKISESFGMQAEYASSKETTDYTLPPVQRRSLPEEAFDSTKDTKTIQVHPTDPKKTM
jgi:hypothetical protein